MNWTASAPRTSEDINLVADEAIAAVTLSIGKIATLSPSHSPGETTGAASMR